MKARRGVDLNWGGGSGCEALCREETSVITLGSRVNARSPE